jgi:hypothetical protein
MAWCRYGFPVNCQVLCYIGVLIQAEVNAMRITHKKL